MIIKPLGTISPYCKGDKNCPGFLVEYEGSKLLLDCGNGITRLLNLPVDLKGMNIIISHLHKDHYSDLFSLGYATYVNNKLGFLDEKVPVYYPDYPTNIPVEQYYSSSDDWGTRTVYKKLEDATLLESFKEHYFDLKTFKENTKITIGDLQITFSSNPHFIASYAIKIKSPYHTLVYSGDTGYAGNTLGEFAADVDLLICESSLLRGQLRHHDGHLYAYEAATIAKRANVKQLMLTHFWPEIDSSEYLYEAQAIFENTLVAEEGKQLVLRRSS